MELRDVGRHAAPLALKDVEDTDGTAAEAASQGDNGKNEATLNRTPSVLTREASLARHGPAAQWVRVRALWDLPATRERPLRASCPAISGRPGARMYTWVVT